MIPNMNLINLHIKESLDDWAKNGHQPGGFLSAVLENNLFEACARADSTALDNLPHIVQYIYNALPVGCWGSKEKMKVWRRYLQDTKNQENTLQGQ